MRDYLRANAVEFDDRNIRQSEQAKEELQELTGSLVVPLLISGDTRIVGYDPDALADFVAEYQKDRG